MSKKHKLTSESKPSIQGAGGGIHLEDLHECEQQSLVKSETPINNKDPSPNPGSSFAPSVGDCVTIQKDDQQQEEPGVLNDIEEFVVFKDKWIKFLSDPNNLEIIMNERQIALAADQDFKFSSLYLQSICMLNPQMKKCLLKKLFGPYRAIAISPSISFFFDQIRKPLFIHYSNAGEENKINQYGVYLIFMKDGSTWTSRKFHPADEDENFRHSEELMLREIDERLQQNRNMVQGISIYSYYSPCLKRTGCIPCMFQLLLKACEWNNKYQIFTDVAFTEFYLIKYKKYFGDLTFDKISCSNNVYHYCIEQCMNTPFKIRHMWKNIKTLPQYSSKGIKTLSKYLWKNIETKVLEILLPYENINKKTRYEVIKTTHNFLKERAEKYDVYKNLLVSEFPISFKFPPEVQDKIHEELAKEWNNMVEDSFMFIITECIQVDLSKAAIISFEKKLEPILGSRRFFRLHHIHSFSC